MATPFINSIGPSALDGYKPAQPREEQPSNILATFLDAMDVRMAVFVDEQNVPAEVEFDIDDPRSRHWVVYASVNKIESPEKLADDGITVLEPRRSSTTTLPIGTLRCVPFPHPPHPTPGKRYLGGELEDDGTKTDVAAGDDASPSLVVRRPSLKLSNMTDRKTSLHDGVEPYVKLGRLAVAKEFRRHKLASLLVKTALQWLRTNPGAFDLSISEVGLEQLGAGDDAKVPRWDGLVCVHAQTAALAFWEKLGFEKDEEMGTWWEDGIEHHGMFHKLKVRDELRVIR
jgi:predicted GNAT family N-acyltransferase